MEGTLKGFVNRDWGGGCALSDKRRAHGVEMWCAQWRYHEQRVREQKVRRGNKARGQWITLNDNVVSGVSTQKRAEKRGTWEAANKQSCDMRLNI